MYKYSSQELLLFRVLLLPQVLGTKKKSAKEAVDENSQTITRNLDYNLFLDWRGEKVLINTVGLHSTCQD